MCQEAFASLHGIGLTRIKRIARYGAEHIHSPAENRGGYRKERALSEEVRQQIHQHISSFPPQESHYSRKDNYARQYLPAELTVAQMHRMYLELYEPDVHAQMQSGEKVVPVVKYEYYPEYFNRNFNLSFGQPRTDTCSICDELSVRIRNESSAETKRQLEQELSLHHRKAEIFYESLRQCTKLAVENENVATICFDFQKNMPLPKLSVNEIYYMRQLWLFNFGVHNCKDKSASMYCWDEPTAKRGANEVVSCLHHYFTQLPEVVDTLYLFPDGCGGQNKNSIVMCFLYSLVKLGRFRLIVHTFPIRGHSFLPCDRDFALIEKLAVKNDTVYVPAQWISLIQSARPSNPFYCVTVNQQMVYDFRSHNAKLFKNAYKSEGRKIRIRDTKVFQYSDSHPSEVWVRYSMSELAPWEKFSIEKPRARITLPERVAYSGQLPIKSAKLDDLRKLEKYIPPDYKHFYTNLATGPCATEGDEEDE